MDTTKVLPTADEITTYWQAADAMAAYDRLLERFCACVDQGHHVVAARAAHHLERFPMAHVQRLLAQGGR